MTFNFSIVSVGREPQQPDKSKLLFFGIYVMINIDSTCCQSLVTVAATIFLKGNFEQSQSSSSSGAAVLIFAAPENSRFWAWIWITLLVFIVEHSDKNHF